VIDEQLEKANWLVDKKGVAVESLHAALSRKAVDGKYRKFVIEGKKPPAPKKKGEDAAKQPFANTGAELPIGDSPRIGTGDEVVITECSDFQ